MNTLGATGPGRASPLDVAAARGPDPEAAGAVLDVFGAVLGALTSASAPGSLAPGSLAPGAPVLGESALGEPAADPDRPAARRAEASPETALPINPGEPANPLLLLAAVMPASPGATPPLAPRESLEALVARVLPAGTPAAGAPPSADLATSARLPASAEAPASAALPAPDARTRVSVLRRETHFAPVLPGLRAATAPVTAGATSDPGGARDGLGPVPDPRPGPGAPGLAWPDLARTGQGLASGAADGPLRPVARQAVQDPWPAPAGPVPRPLPERPPSLLPAGTISPPTAAGPAVATVVPAVTAAPAAEPAAQVVSEPAPPRQTVGSVPAGAGQGVPLHGGPPVADGIPPVNAPPVAAPDPDRAPVAPVSPPESDARRLATPAGPVESLPRGPVPASDIEDEAPAQRETPRVSADPVPRIGAQTRGADAQSGPVPEEGAASTRPAEMRPSPLGTTASPEPAAVADLPPPPVRVLPPRADGTANPTIPAREPAVMPAPGAPASEIPPALRDASLAGRGGPRQAEDAPVSPPDRKAVAVPASTTQPPEPDVGSVRAVEAGPARPAETATGASGGTAGPSTGLLLDPAAPGPSLTAAPPTAAPTAPAQQVAAAILGQVPRGTLAPPPGAAGLDGPLRILTLQLHPADLGTVLVRMRLRDGHLEMSLQASREETATLLAEGGEVLTDLLRQGGYQPERVTIVSGPPPAPGEAQTFQTRTDAGPDQPPPDQSGRRQPEGRAFHSSETQADTHERNPASVPSSPERGGVYL